MKLSTWIICFGATGLFGACGQREEVNWLSHQDPILKDLIQENKIHGMSSQQLVSNYGDVLIAIGRSNDLDDPKLFQVTKDFGPTIIDMDKLPYKSEVGDAGMRPWSSWWFPKFENTLFYEISSSPSSALTKYDYYRRKLKSGNFDSAARIEASQYNPQALRWEGLCNAWALASVLHREPRLPVSFKERGFSSSFVFTVGEMKGLLLKTFEAVEDKHLNFYGQKFTGDVDGWIHPDPFADQFHRFIEIQLFRDKKAFIMDHDAGIQVWNEPVYKANYSMQAVPDNPRAVLVRMWLYSAMPSQKNEINNTGLKENVREYTYLLMGELAAGNKLTVKSGIWLKGSNGVDSRRDHPDYFITIPRPQEVRRISFNSGILAEIVDEILAKSY